MSVEEKYQDIKRDAKFQIGNFLIRTQHIIAFENGYFVLYVEMRAKLPKMRFKNMATFLWPQDVAEKAR